MSKTATTKQITKVHFSKDCKLVTIVYKEKSTGGSATVEYNCNEQPLPEFRSAMNALALHVNTICEFPSHDRDRLEMRGFTISTDEETNERGIVFTAIRRRKDNKPFCINTPPMMSIPDGGTEDVDHFLPFGCMEVVDVVCEYALAYMKGERAQGELKFDGEDNAEEQQADEPTVKKKTSGRSRNNNVHPIGQAAHA